MHAPLAVQALIQASDPSVPPDERLPITSVGHGTGLDAISAKGTGVVHFLGLLFQRGHEFFAITFHNSLSPYYFRAMVRLFFARRQKLAY